jgi:hypothetical protein
VLVKPNPILRELCVHCLQCSFVQGRASHRRLRVVWLETSSEGQRIVGLHIPNPAVNAVISGTALRLLLHFFCLIYDGIDD